MRVIRPVLLVAAAATFSALALPAASATAAVVDRNPYSGTNDWVDTDCGISVNVHRTYSGTFSTRTLPGGGYTFASDNYQWKETHTDPATGQWYTISGNAMWRDLTATHLYGSVYAVDQVEAGQPFVVTDSKGRAVLRDRGSTMLRFAVDVSTGQWVDFYSFGVHGPHPSMALNQLCIVQGTLLSGTGSKQFAQVRPVGTTDAALGYYEYLPPSYSSSGAKSPLIVFLHGYGESGDGTASGLQAITGGSIPMLIGGNGWPTSRPFVVLAPQHPYADQDPAYPACEPLPWPGSCWMASQYAQGDQPGSPFFGANQVHDFITYAVAHYNVDPHRVYLTGLSDGGYGTWAYSAHWAGSGQVAAMVPISADGRPAWNDKGCAMALPTWAFHGENDDIINPLGSTETVAHLETCPGEEAHVTTYPGLYHEPAVWNGTYNTLQAPVDIYAWFLSHSTP